MFLYRTKSIFERVIKWWVLCALEKSCIATNHNPSRGCFFKGDSSNFYNGCHRYDQSAFNILLLNHYDFDRWTYYTKHRFIKIHRYGFTYKAQICWVSYKWPSSHVTLLAEWLNVFQTSNVPLLIILVLWCICSRKSIKSWFSFQRQIESGHANRVITCWYKHPVYTTATRLLFGRESDQNLKCTEATSRWETWFVTMWNKEDYPDSSIMCYYLSYTVK